MADPTRWTERLAGFATRQAEAVREGREAEAEGRPVIYIHGRPYADPGDPAENAGEVPNLEPGESPFPWDLWDDWTDPEERG